MKIENPFQIIAGEKKEFLNAKRRVLQEVKKLDFSAYCPEEQEAVLAAPNRMFELGLSYELEKKPREFLIDASLTVTSPAPTTDVVTGYRTTELAIDSSIVEAIISRLSTAERKLIAGTLSMNGLDTLLRKMPTLIEDRPHLNADRLVERRIAQLWTFCRRIVSSGRPT